MPRFCVVLLLAACDREEPLPDAAMPVLEQVALVPVAANRDVDVLFVIEDSIALELQINLRNAFPAFIDALGRGPGLPNLHIGAISGDLGTRGALDSAPGPSIGSGPGSCSGEGKAGRLQTNGTVLVNGTFISDTANTDGTRLTNYSGPLVDAMQAITALGASGCGFEQPLEAVKRALDNNPSNTGFLRPGANLVVINAGDEDDCSFAHSTLLGPESEELGPLQSFRCYQFGVVCDEDIGFVGAKTNCRSNELSPYMMPMSHYADFFHGMKADPRRVYFASIAGPAEPVVVEPRTPPGGGTPIPAIASSCRFDGSNGPEIANPAVRIEHLATLLPRATIKHYCQSDLTGSLVTFARHIRNMTGDPCLTEDIAMPAECRVMEHAGASTTEIPPCPPLPSSTTCWQLLEDPACTTAQRMRIDIQRTEAAPADSWLEVRCRL